MTAYEATEAQLSFQHARTLRRTLIARGAIVPLQARGFATLQEWQERVSPPTRFAFPWIGQGVPSLRLDTVGRRAAAKRIASYHEHGPAWDEETGVSE